MEQLVARRAHNPKVTGSSPVPATLKEDASASFFVLNYLGIWRAHIRLGGHRFASCSRYIERGCFGILFCFKLLGNLEGSYPPRRTQVCLLFPLH